MKVHVDNVGFSYGTTPILKNVCFDAYPGEVTTIIGANGAGKTTLLKCVADLYKHEGSVYFDDVVVTRKDLPKIMSYMEQNTDCEAELNVFEIVLLGMVQSLSFYVSEQDIAKVNEVLKLLDIQRFADRKVGELSGGQRQLVFIAQALVKDPKVLILDEPTSALDLYHQFKLIKFIRKITQQRGCVTIMTLHHLDVALKYSDRMVVIDSNTVYQEGTPDEVFTEKMLAEVYRVKADIIYDDKGNKHIQVLEPLDEDLDDDDESINNDKFQYARPQGDRGIAVMAEMNISHRGQIQWGITNLPDIEPETILDVGTGGGIFARYMLERYGKSKVTAIDISDTAVEYCKDYNKDFVEEGRLQVDQGSVSHMPYGDGAFDLVVSNASHPYWTNLANDLKDIARVTKSGGVVCLTVASSITEENIDQKKSEQFGANLFTDSETIRMLDEAGFDAQVYSDNGASTAFIGVKR
jgi:iron complex transport system ATP-binding protein